VSSDAAIACRARFIYADLVTGLAVVLAWAVATGAPPASPSPAAGAPGRFSVVPSAASAAPVPWPKGGPARLVWTGFQAAGGAARLFVQTTAEVGLDVRHADGGLVVTLRRCRVHMRNNSRRLDTRFFATPVQEVSVHQRGRDVRLEVAVKGAASPTPHREPGPNGTQFWIIDVAPPGAPAPHVPQP
jgi:hypothetical protein